MLGDAILQKYLSALKSYLANYCVIRTKKDKQ